MSQHVGGLSQNFKLFISSIGFVSDAYNLFIINIVKLMMAETGDPESQYQALAKDYAPSLAMAAPLGAILGQLLFGALADRIGRRVIFMVTISCVIVGCFGSATVSESEHFNCYQQLVFWLFLVGFGVGGEYPLSATISSEASSNEKRGRNVALVFSMQGVGNILAGLVSLITIAALFDNGSTVQQEWAWRICLAFGGLPGLLTVYWRWKMEESHIFSEAQHTLDEEIEEDLEREAHHHVTPTAWQTMSREMAQACSTLYKFRWVLAGTAVPWFIFDVTYYANSTFSGSILQAFGFHQSLKATALVNLIVGFIGLPGYYLGAFTIDSIGRKPLQIFGFLGLSLVYLILALTVKNLPGGLFVFLYGLTFLASNWGPNTTTFVIPAESFPTWARATCHGISAASGKFGAVVGDQTLGRLVDHLEGGAGSIAPVLYICAAIGVVGAVWSFFFTVDRSGASLEELDAAEDPHMHQHEAAATKRGSGSGEEDPMLQAPALRQHSSALLSGEAPHPGDLSPNPFLSPATPGRSSLQNGQPYA